MTTPASEAILDVVVELLDTEGYGAVQLRTVASRARVGLDTIYKLFRTRDELVIGAVARWMRANGFSELSAPPSDVSVYDGMMTLFRHVFEPWERHPRMLEAYFRARNLPGGDRLDSIGIAVLSPVSQVVYAGLDQRYVEDVVVIVRSVAYAAIGQFTHGELTITEILPLIERTLYRLTGDNATLVAARNAASPCLIPDGCARRGDPAARITTL